LADAISPLWAKPYARRRMKTNPSTAITSIVPAPVQYAATTPLVAAFTWSAAVAVGATVETCATIAPSTAIPTTPPADAARVAPRQAQLALGTVKQVMRDAMRRGQRVDPAVLEVKAPRYEEREPVFLGAAEVEQLASCCAEPHLIVFAALSGLRLGEVLALRDADVNLDEGSVLVTRAARKGVEGRTKTRKRRRVYLCARAVTALRAQLLARRPNPRGLVFPSPRSDSVWNSDNFRADVFAKSVKRAAAAVEPARRTDVARLDFHDLRHTFASLMIAAGANPLQLAEVLGHSDQYGRPDPTLVWKRYGHLYPGSTREAAAALDRHLKATAS
jgi:integrase